MATMVMSARAWKVHVLVTTVQVREILGSIKVQNLHDSCSDLDVSASEGPMSGSTHGGLSFYMILVGVLALLTVCGCAACAFILSHLHRKRKKPQAVPQEDGINNQREFVNLIRNVDRPVPQLPAAAPLTNAPAPAPVSRCYEEIELTLPPSPAPSHPSPALKPSHAAKMDISNQEREKLNRLHYADNQELEVWPYPDLLKLPGGFFSHLLCVLSTLLLTGPRLQLLALCRCCRYEYRRWPFDLYECRWHGQTPEEQSLLTRQVKRVSSPLGLLWQPWKSSRGMMSDWKLNIKLETKRLAFECLRHCQEQTEDVPPCETRYISWSMLPSDWCPDLHWTLTDWKDQRSDAYLTLFLCPAVCKYVLEWTWDWTLLVFVRRGNLLFSWKRSVRRECVLLNQRLSSLLRSILKLYTVACFVFVILQFAWDVCFFHTCV